MASKYDKVAKTLKKLPEELMEGGADYQYKIKMTAAEIKDKTPTALARDWKQLRALLKEVEEKKSNINLQLRAHERLLEEAYEAEGISKLSLAEGGSVAIHPDPIAKVVNPAVYHEFCIDSGFISLMNIPWQTTNSNAKELLLLGKPLPPGVDLYVKSKFSLYQK